MFVPLRYKRDVGSAPRVRVSRAQLTAVPGRGFGARNLAVAPSETRNGRPHGHASKGAAGRRRRSRGHAIDGA